MLDGLRAAGFDVLTRNHAEAILALDFPDELGGLVAALSFRRGEEPREDSAASLRPLGAKTGSAIVAADGNRPEAWVRHGRPKIRPHPCGRCRRNNIRVP